ncbi:MAG: HYR domain-containing protein [Ferruginibacter sp.]
MEMPLFLYLPPTSLLACPSGINVTTEAGTCAAVVNYTAAATGQIHHPLLVIHSVELLPEAEQEPEAGMLFNKGITTVTITASNGCSADAQCSFDVTVTGYRKSCRLIVVANQQFCAVAGDIYTVPAISVPRIIVVLHQSVIT